MNIIEKQNTQIRKEPSFFTRKRIIFFTICFVLTVFLLVLTITYILNINFTLLFNLIYKNLTQNNQSILFLLLLLIAPIFRTYLNINYYFFMLKKMNVIVRKRDWFNLGFILIFIISITPSSIGAEPYIIYWLNKRIFNLKKASAIVLASSFLGQASSVFITIPSFIYFCTLYSQIISKPNGNIAFWFSVVGIFMDLMVFVTFIILIFSKKVHYFFAFLFNKLKKFFQLNYKRNEDIKNEIITNSEFKKEVANLLGHHSISIMSFFVYLTNNFLYYIYFYFALLLIFPISISNENFWYLFNVINVGVTANNFVPLPGSEGSLQVILQLMLNANINGGFNIASDSLRIIFDNAIFVWRFFTTQLTAMVGALILLNLIDKFLIGWFNKKINNNLETKKGILIISNNVDDINSNFKNNFYFNKIVDFYESKNKDITYFIDIKEDYLRDLMEKRDAILLKINNLNNIYKEKYFYFMQYLFLKKFLDKTNTKIFRKYLKTKNFEFIFDFSDYGYKIFSKNKNYFWIQEKTYNELRWRIFNSKTKNWLFSYTKKIILGFDPFFYIKNVIVTENSDRNIGFNDHFIFLARNNKQIDKFLLNINLLF